MVRSGLQPRFNSAWRRQRLSGLCGARVCVCVVHVCVMHVCCIWWVVCCALTTAAWPPCAARWMGRSCAPHTCPPVCPYGCVYVCMYACVHFVVGLALCRCARCASLGHHAVPGGAFAALLMRCTHPHTYTHCTLHRCAVVAAMQQQVLAAGGRIAWMRGGTVAVVHGVEHGHGALHRVLTLRLHRPQRTRRALHKHTHTAIAASPCIICQCVQVAILTHAGVFMRQAQARKHVPQRSGGLVQACSHTPGQWGPAGTRQSRRGHPVPHDGQQRAHASRAPSCWLLSGVGQQPWFGGSMVARACEDERAQRRDPLISSATLPRRSLPCVDFEQSTGAVGGSTSAARCSAVRPCLSRIRTSAPDEKVSYRLNVGGCNGHVYPRR